MELTRALGERLSALADAPADAPHALAQWRLLVDESVATQVGLKENAVGGPYDAPNRVATTRGEVYLVWRDGRISTSTIDRTTPANFDADVALWRQAAFEDAYAPDVLGAQSVPKVPLHDAELDALVEEPGGAPFELLEDFRRSLAAAGAKRVSGAVTYGRLKRRVLTSRGLDHTSESTRFRAYAEADGRVYDGLSLRRTASAEQAERLVANVVEAMRLLDRPVSARAGRQPVVFLPGEAEAVFGHYVLANMNGQRVLNGAGAYTLEQFNERAELFSRSLDVRVDPTRAYAPGAYELTSEGVPARAYPLIDHGRLVTPLLDLRHAKRAGLAATPFPNGGSTLAVGGADRTLTELLRELGSGFVVYEMLGLHTQDAASGRFSLTVSQGFVVENGELVGSARALIAGNFFEALREGVRWGTVPGKEMPALVIEAEVSPA